MNEISRIIKESEDYQWVNVQSVCSQNLLNLIVKGASFGHDAFLQKLNPENRYEAVYKISSLLKCNTELSENYIYLNYNFKLNEHVLRNISGVKNGGIVFEGKGCEDTSFKRKMAELLTNSFSLINCHPEVVEQAFKNLKYI